MTAVVVTQIISMLLKFVTPDVLRRGLDAMFDTIEEAVENSPNQWDNLIVLPLIRTARAALNVPDEPMGSRGLGGDE